jgi:hypothetical protein
MSVLAGLVTLCAQQAAPPATKLPAFLPPSSGVARPPASLPIDIIAVQEAITFGEADDAKYAGGLVKTLIQLRFATLRQTLAMLEQRQKASDYNVALKFTVDGRAYAPPPDAAQQVLSLDQDLADTRIKAAAAEMEASKYSGGLVLSLALTTLATVRQTESMLEQKRFALKYGLPQVVGSQGPAAVAPRPAGEVSPVGMNQKPFEIVDVNSKVTESNDTWWKYAWKLTVRNSSDRHLSLQATIEFLDAEGFVVDSDTEYNLGIAAGSTQTFTGYALVTAKVAGTIRGTKAKVGVR